MKKLLCLSWRIRRALANDVKVAKSSAGNFNVPDRRLVEWIINKHYFGNKHLPPNLGIELNINNHHYNIVFSDIYNIVFSDKQNAVLSLLLQRNALIWIKEDVSISSNLKQKVVKLNSYKQVKLLPLKTFSLWKSLASAQENARNTRRTWAIMAK